MSRLHCFVLGVLCLPGLLCSSCLTSLVARHRLQADDWWGLLEICRTMEPVPAWGRVGRRCCGRVPSRLQGQSGGARRSMQGSSARAQTVQTRTAPVSQTLRGSDQPGRQAEAGRGRGCPGPAGQGHLTLPGGCAIVPSSPQSNGRPTPIGDALCSLGRRSSTHFATSPLSI